MLPGVPINIQLNRKLRLSPGYFGHLMSFKPGITLSGRVIDPDYQGDIGLLLHKGGKKHYRLCLDCRKSFRLYLGATISYEQC